MCGDGAAAGGVSSEKGLVVQVVQEKVWSEFIYW